MTSYPQPFAINPVRGATVYDAEATAEAVRQCFDQFHTAVVHHLINLNENITSGTKVSIASFVNTLAEMENDLVDDILASVEQ